MVAVENEENKQTGAVQGFGTGDIFAFPKDMGDMFKEQETAMSHTGIQLSESDMEMQRTAARALISQTFANGNSVEMAANLAKAQYPAVATELHNLIEREKGRYGDVPETQVEADRRKEEEARAISNALLGGVTFAAGGVAATGLLSGSVRELLSGYAGGTQMLDVKDRHAEIANALGGGLLNGGFVQEINDLSGVSPIDAQKTQGIPDKQKTQDAGLQV